MATDDPLGDLIRAAGPSIFPPEVQEQVDALLSKDAVPLTPERRKRESVERVLRVRRTILNLAAFASGHRWDRGSWCRECKKTWPCADVMRAAGPALDAFNDYADHHTPRGST